jgi:transcriptional regulator with XRE-family HTH domain
VGILIAKKTPNVIDRHVGNRVRMRRMMISMSQEKLGGSLGITFQQIQKYEKGTNRIGASRLHQIAGLLGVPVTFFYENALSTAANFTEASNTVDIADFMATSQGLALAKAFVQISDPKLRRIVVGLVEAIGMPSDANEK